jgi:tRNA1Val (adenine37-N6)-methyltransferase
MNKKNYEPFNFKKFSITQNNAAMKIGTDGILLGAWAKTSNINNGLDIGTGTGVISLMLCQRFSEIQIDSIENSESALKDASINIDNSQWKNRINLINENFINYIPKIKYDLIISNPPFFSKSLKPENLERSRARHQEDLSYKNILKFSKKYLNLDGSLNIIIPFNDKEEAYNLSKNYNLNLVRQCIVSSKPNKKPHRLLMEFSFRKEETKNEYLTIEEHGRHQYSEDYKKLTREFYTIFN